jgi:hypothetical protein
MPMAFDFLSKAFHIFVKHFYSFVYRNPNLGLATKARGLQGCGPRGKPGSVRECDGINLHTPKGTLSLGVGVPVHSQIFKA